MLNAIEITRDTINDFMFIQDCMIIAKEEKSDKTYDKLREKYLALKAILSATGVNLTDIDKIKE